MKRSIFYLSIGILFSFLASSHTLAMMGGGRGGGGDHLSHGEGAGVDVAEGHHAGGAAVHGVAGEMGPPLAVSGDVCGIRRPSRRERAASSAPVGSAPISSSPGRDARAATQIPPIRPPPPTGATIASRSGTCSRSSSATVP